MSALGLLLILAIVLSSLTLSHQTMKRIESPKRAVAKAEAFKPHYIRVAMIYEGTANGWVLKKEMLDKYDYTFVGRSMVKGHEIKDPDKVVGRIIAADLRYDKKLKKHYIEGIVKVLSEETIKKIKLGLYYHVSIRWAVLDRRGNEVKKMEGVEVSIVGAAASRHARILEMSQEKLELSKRGKY